MFGNRASSNAVLPFSTERDKLPDLMVSSCLGVVLLYLAGSTLGMLLQDDALSEKSIVVVVAIV